MLANELSSPNHGPACSKEPLGLVVSVSGAQASVRLRGAACRLRCVDATVGSLIIEHHAFAYRSESLQDIEETRQSTASNAISSVGQCTSLGGSSNTGGIGNLSARRDEYP